MFHLLLVIIYLAFISLGLPDGLLGAAWPSMYQEFQVPVSYAGIISMIIAGGTIVSSLQSDRLTLRFGPGRVTAVSVAMTAAALFGYSVPAPSSPYASGQCPTAWRGERGRGLNNYVALHYASRHMSWLHCMWGVGASAGPYIMGYVLSGGGIWNTGYRCIGLLQIALTAILFSACRSGGTGRETAGTARPGRRRRRRRGRGPRLSPLPQADHRHPRRQGSPWSPSSATARWSRRPDSGRPATWRCTRASPRRQPPSSPACSSSASRPGGRPAASSPCASTTRR